MNKCTKVRALRSCSGDVHVARDVVSLVVQKVADGTSLDKTTTVGRSQHTLNVHLPSS